MLGCLMGGRHRGPVIEVLEHSLGFTFTWDSCSSSAEDGLKAGWLRNNDLVDASAAAHLPALAPSTYSGSRRLVTGTCVNGGNG
jgi:hypothetical protein